MLCPSSRCSQSRILANEGCHVRVSHISVNPACRVSQVDKVTASGMTEWNLVKPGNQPEDHWFTSEGISRVSVVRDFRHNSLVLVQKIKPKAR